MTTTTSHAALTARLLAHIADTSQRWKAETTIIGPDDFGMTATTLWLWPTWNEPTIVAVWVGNRFEANVWTAVDAPTVHIATETELVDTIINTITNGAN